MTPVAALLGGRDRVLALGPVAAGELAAVQPVIRWPIETRVGGGPYDAAYALEPTEASVIAAVIDTLTPDGVLLLARVSPAMLTAYFKAVFAFGETWLPEPAALAPSAWVLAVGPRPWPRRRPSLWDALAQEAASGVVIERGYGVWKPVR